MPQVALNNGRHFESLSNISILEAARTAGLVLEHSCRTGRCGQCKARVVSGETRVLKAEESLTDVEASAGIVLTCARSAETDLALDIADLGLPADIQAKILPCRIQSLELLANDVLRVMLRLPPGAGFKYLPGQYVDVIADGGRRRSYSIANAPAASQMLEFHIRRVPNGEMSDYWFNRARANDLLRLEGPLGTFFLRHVADEDIVLLATGTGYAPIKAILESLGVSQATSTGRRLLLWGGRTSDDHYHDARFENVSLEYFRVLSRETGDGSHCGYVQDVLLANYPDLSNVTVYACGSSSMIESARKKLVDAGLPSQKFFSDAFLSSNTTL